jgi:hypothetical protein
VRAQCLHRRTGLCGEIGALIPDPSPAKREKGAQEAIFLPQSAGIATLDPPYRCEASRLLGISTQQLSRKSGHQLFFGNRLI